MIISIYRQQLNIPQYIRKGGLQTGHGKERTGLFVRGRVSGGLGMLSVCVSPSHPVHYVQLTAQPLDGTADLEQLKPQGIVYGQTGCYSVGEV